ncbi:MAG: asparaginase domain-containing protein [Paracoccaceae bacterium]
MNQDSRARLRLIYAGGTIGAAGRPLAPLPGNAFRERWDRAVPPCLPAVADVDWTCLAPAIDSTDATPADWGRLARAVVEAAAEGASAAVVLQGTDTLANAAAALAFLTTAVEGARPESARPVARLAMPVVLTGAQRPLFDGDAVAKGTDALDNLALACEAAREGPGVRVAFGGRVMPGARVVKASSRADAAFESPPPAIEAPALPAADPAGLGAELDRLAPRLGARAVLVATMAPEAPEHQAAMLAGALDRLGTTAGAVLLLGYGLGNVPARERLASVIENAQRGGVAVFVGTQALAGGAAPDLYAAGAWLAEAGARSIGAMTPVAAHAKLHIALAHGLDADGIARFMAAPMAGEDG